MQACQVQLPASALVAYNMLRKYSVVMVSSYRQASLKQCVVSSMAENALLLHVFHIAKACSISMPNTTTHPGGAQKAALPPLHHMHQAAVILIIATTIITNISHGLLYHCQFREQVLHPLHWHESVRAINCRNSS